MSKYIIILPEELELFYKAIADKVNLSTEQVLEDSLYKFAGTLSISALNEKNVIKTA